MEDGQNDAIAVLDGQYTQLEHEIDAALIRADRIRDQCTQLCDRSTHLCDRSEHLHEQADITCAEAQTLIAMFLS
jgi:hypothetical protein